MEDVARLRLTSGRTQITLFENSKMAATASQTAPFSLTEARSIVRDLFSANERIYWVDFLTTIVIGHLCFALTRLTFFLPIQSLAVKFVIAAIPFGIQCASFYRAIMFVHEIVHLPDKKLRTFRVTWNLLCG